MSHTRKSTVSQCSRSISQTLNDAEELTDAELITKVNDLKRQIRILKLENGVFENTILRLEPSLMHGIQQALDYAMKLQSSGPSGLRSMSLKSTSRFGFGFGESLASPSRLLASPSNMSARRFESSVKLGGTGTVIFGSGPRINVLEKSELVATEISIWLAKVEKARAKATKQHALLKAELEETDVRVEDIEKASVTFDQEVIVEGWDIIAQRIPAEIWIRYMTEWVKISDSQIGKLRLRTSTLNTQHRILKGQIKVKAELNERLRPVDFDKLKIENAECVKKINKKLLQIAELKSMTGDANLNRTIHKNIVMEQNNYLTRIHNGINKREKRVVAMDKETKVIRAQAKIIAQELEDIKKLRMAYEVPDIMDYVRVKSELTDLRNVVKTLENRAHIKQIALLSVHSGAGGCDY